MLNRLSQPAAPFFKIRFNILFLLLRGRFSSGLGVGPAGRSLGRRGVVAGQAEEGVAS